jgi:trehalose 6-phosphate synthase
MDRFSVTRNGHTTVVQPHPISIDSQSIASSAPSAGSAEERQLRRKLGLRNRKLLVGIDRVDYTKGIPERFRAVDRLLALHPKLKGQFHLVQIGAPSRVHISEYRELNEELVALAEEINWRYGASTWKPIVFINEHYGSEQIYALYRIATACVVSSLHDGMNLVAKEFVAARNDQLGALVLSQFTGAARELGDALLINPYDVDGFAEALRQALVMPEEEQRRRMQRMRRHIADQNIYRWAGQLLSCGAKLMGATACT